MAFRVYCLSKVASLQIVHGVLAWMKCKTNWQVDEILIETVVNLGYFDILMLK